MSNNRSQFISEQIDGLSHGDFFWRIFPKSKSTMKDMVHLMRSLQRENTSWKHCFLGFLRFLKKIINNFSNIFFQWSKDLQDFRRTYKVLRTPTEI